MRTVRGEPPPDERWVSITMPTLAMSGAKSPASMRNAMQALAGVLPNARYRTRAGRRHVVTREAHASVLVEFLPRLEPRRASALHRGTKMV